MYPVGSSSSIKTFAFFPYEVIVSGSMSLDRQAYRPEHLPTRVRNSFSEPSDLYS